MPSHASPNPTNSSPISTHASLFTSGASFNRFTHLLPATYRDHKGDVVGVNTPDYLDSDLNVDALDALHDWLWVCGRPLPPRPLHHQAMMSRDIVITEAMNMHLVWSEAGNRIFVKPIPLYLLNDDFWDAFLTPHTSSCFSFSPASSSSSSSSSTIPLAASASATTATIIQSPTEKRRSVALGFLHSYTALVATQSDFRIAQDKGLLPDEEHMTWNDWTAFSARVLAGHDYGKVDRRFRYGELRLGRLNTVMRWCKGHVFRGYSRVDEHVNHTAVLRAWFQTVAVLLCYAGLVLTAMQVGLATARLSGDDVFQTVSGQFAVFVLVALVVVAGVILLVVLVSFGYNWWTTSAFHKQRGKQIGVGVAGNAPSVY